MTQRLRAWHLLRRVLFEDATEQTNTDLARDLSNAGKCWEDLLSMANHSFVTAAVWSSLRSRCLEDQVPTTPADYLSSFHSLNEHRNRGIWTQFLECVEVLNDVGIETMPFKGTAYLADELYRDIGERFLTDLDLLVRPEQADRAEKSLIDNGYSRASNNTEATKSHQLVPLVKVGRPVELEIHKAPVPYRLSAALSADVMWETANRTERDQICFSLPSPTSNLLNSFLHNCIVDGHPALYMLPLRLFLDAHRLLLEHSQEIQIDQLTAAASAVNGADELRYFAHALRSLSGRRYLDTLSPSIRDRVHYRASIGATATHTVWVWAMRCSQLSTNSLIEKYDLSEKRLTVHWFRIREFFLMAGGFIQRRLASWKKRAAADHEVGRGL